VNFADLNFPIRMPPACQVSRRCGQRLRLDRRKEAVSLSQNRETAGKIFVENDVARNAAGARLLGRGGFFRFVRFLDL
jgi:hypothetical protein